MRRIAIISILACLLFSLPLSAQRKQRTSYVENAYQALNFFGDEEKAIVYLDEQLRLYPKDADALFLRAILNNKRGQKMAALEDITLAAKYTKKTSRQNEAVVYWWKASIEKELGNSEASKTSLKTAYDLASRKYPQNYYEIASAYAARLLADEEYDSSDALNNEILIVFPEDQRAKLGLVKSAAAQGKYKEGLEMLERMDGLKDGSREICRDKMVLYGTMKAPFKATDAALEYLKKAGLGCGEEIMPYLLETYDYSVAKLKTMAKGMEDRSEMDAFLGLIHYQAGRYPKAVETLSALDEEGRLDYGMRSLMADSYASMGKYEDAVRVVSQCLDSIPNSALFSNRASYYRAMGEYEKSLADYESAIEGDPDEPYFYYAKGVSEEMLGRDEDALESYSVSVNIDPGVKFCYSRVARARMLLERGDTLSAKKDLVAVLCTDLNADDSSCRQFALLYNGDGDAALEWMDRIIANTPTASAYYDLARIQAYLGNKEEAIQALKKSIELGEHSFAKISKEKQFEILRTEKEYISIFKENNVAE